jgi:hypothetical protein
MISVGVPYIEQTDSRVYVCSNINDNGNEYVIRFGTYSGYARYLTDDRLDPFVVALLPRAMRKKEIIKCMAPVSRSLLYQINEYLVPVCSSRMKDYHLIKVEAGAVDDLTENAGAVATGYSGGVDSMHTVMNMTDPSVSPFKLTHLVIANCGAYEGGNDEKKISFYTDKATNGIVKETGLELLLIDTNLHQVHNDENYLSVISYRLSSCVLALQKLFSVYFISTTYEFAKFSFDINDSAYADLFLLPYLSTRTTKLYSTGGQKPRIEKLRELSDYEPAKRYLHPCIMTRRSRDCRCIKCVFTKVALYALGTLDRFGEVFDLDEFEKNKDWYIAQAIVNRNIIHYGEGYALLKEKGMITARSIQMAKIIAAAQKVADEHKDIIAGIKNEGR